MRVETVRKGSQTWRCEWLDSIEELRDLGMPYRETIYTKHSRGDVWSYGDFEDCDRYIESGWDEGIKEAMPIVEEALKTLEDEVNIVNFQADWQVAGAEVDMGRYLAGMPECMIEYEPFTVSKVGKVVTLCVSYIYSGGLDTDTIIRRGAAITALAMALERCQHSVEIWLDHSTNYMGKSPVSTKVLVKGANDSIQDGKLAYCLSHPTVLRRLMFAYEHSWPMDVQKDNSVGGGYGRPVDPFENLPEGTMYIPCWNSRQSPKDAVTMVTDTIKKLGLGE